MRQTLLFDCDGVLYPLSELPTKNLVEAMKETSRCDLGLSGDEQRLISKQTRENNQLGMFNYINAMCAYKNYNFDEFCERMATRVDYSKIRENRQLYLAIKQAALQYNVGILTNNSRAHTEAVIRQVFGCDAKLLETENISLFDVKKTEKNGIFLRKQSAGLKLICDRYGYEPAYTTLFDDAVENVVAAQKIGMNGVLIDKDNHLQKALRLFLQPPKIRGKYYE
jgi:FMN phosphatase YigB (HAD superfamily)